MMDSEEELRGFIDNDHFVSCRWFANFLNINVEQTKKIFDKFKASNSDVFATYCVSGQLKNKQLSITIVGEDHLARCKDHFLKVNCTHIYSLQKKKFQHSPNVSVQLNAADTQQANELIAQQPPCLAFLLNSVGGIKLENSHIKPIGKRAAAIVRVISGTDNTEAHMMKSFASAGSKEKTAPAMSSVGKDSSKDSSKDKSKSSSSVANAFFAKAAAASSSTVTVLAAPKSSESTKLIRKESFKVSSATEPVSVPANVATTALDNKNDDDDDEWTEEGAASYKPDKKKLRNRKEIKGTSAAAEDEKSKLTAVDEQCTIEAVSEAKKTTLHVRGAMDDYMEDVAIEQYNSGRTSDGDAATDPSREGDKKRTKKKLVEKVRVM